MCTGSCCCMFHPVQACRCMPQAEDIKESQDADRSQGRRNTCDLVRSQVPNWHDIVLGHLDSISFAIRFLHSVTRKPTTMMFVAPWHLHVVCYFQPAIWSPIIYDQNLIERPSKAVFKRNMFAITVSITVIKAWRNASDQPDICCWSHECENYASWSQRPCSFNGPVLRKLGGKTGTNEQSANCWYLLARGVSY